MAGIAALTSAGLGIYGALQGKPEAKNVQLPPMFQMPRMGEAANLALTGIQNLPYTGAGAQTQPLAWQAAQNAYFNPYAGPMVQGANVASDLGRAAALNQFGAGGALQGYGVSSLPYAQMLQQMGFDPQNAFYQRALDRTTQGTGSYLANSGIGGTPYGAGVMGNTIGNFNLDWENQALQRALQGAQGAGNVLGTAGQAIGAGTGFQSGAAGQYGQFAGLPYAAYSGLNQDQLAALQGYQTVGAGGQKLAMAPVSAYLDYLKGGTAQQGANTNIAQTGLQQAQLAFNQDQTLGKGLGAGIYGLGSAYGKGFPGAQQGFGWLNNMGGGFGIGGA